MQKIIGFCGLIGSGKDSAADYLCNNYGFVRDSFAASLKDAVAMVFGWDRTLLDGRTSEAREWREKIDTWWAKRLNLPHLTPRWVLQQWGTEVIRVAFHDDIWIASMEARLQRSDTHTVISDVRFPNEITAIRRAGGRIYRVQRGADPYWLTLAERANNGDTKSLAQLNAMKIHASERAWAGYPMDGFIENNGTLDEFHEKIKQLVESPESTPLASRVGLGFEVAVGNWHKLS